MLSINRHSLVLLLDNRSRNYNNNLDLTRVILCWFCSFTIPILSEQLEAYIDKTSVDQAIKLKSTWDKSPFSKIRLFSDVLERIKRTSFLQEVSQCRVWFHTMHKTMKKNIDSFDRINRSTRVIRDSYFEIYKWLKFSLYFYKLIQKFSSSI